jgi:hypothetical protein
LAWRRSLECIDRPGATVFWLAAHVMHCLPSSLCPARSLSLSLSQSASTIIHKPGASASLAISSSQLIFQSEAKVLASCACAYYEPLEPSHLNYDLPRVLPLIPIRPTYHNTSKLRVTIIATRRHPGHGAYRCGTKADLRGRPCYLIKKLPAIGRPIIHVLFVPAHVATIDTRMYA